MPKSRRAKDAAPENGAAQAHASGSRSGSGAGAGATSMLVDAGPRSRAASLGEMDVDVKHGLTRPSAASAEVAAAAHALASAPPPAPGPSPAIAFPSPGSPILLAGAKTGGPAALETKRPPGSPIPVAAAEQSGSSALAALESKLQHCAAAACAASAAADGSAASAAMDAQPTPPSDFKSAKKLPHAESSALFASAQHATALEACGAVLDELYSYRVYKAGVSSEICSAIRISYGEIQPGGAADIMRVFRDQRKTEPRLIWDLGAGTGRLALLLFLTMRASVLGVELDPLKYREGVRVARALAQKYPCLRVKFHDCWKGAKAPTLQDCLADEKKTATRGSSVDPGTADPLDSNELLVLELHADPATGAELAEPRRFVWRRQNIFDLVDRVEEADVILMDVHLEGAADGENLLSLLRRVRPGAGVMLYPDYMRLALFMHDAPSDGSGRLRAFRVDKNGRLIVRKPDSGGVRLCCGCRNKPEDPSAAPCTGCGCTTACPTGRPIVAAELPVHFDVASQPLIAVSWNSTGARFCLCVARS
jgi:SAM-dependent methyltransferase